MLTEIYRGCAVGSLMFALGGTVENNNTKDPVPRKLEDKDDKGKHWCELVDARHDIVSEADSSKKHVVIDWHFPEYSPRLRTRTASPNPAQVNLGN